MDLTWLRINAKHIGEISGITPFTFSYMGLCSALVSDAQEHFGVPVHLAQKHAFTTMPIEYADCDEVYVARQNEFFQSLRNHQFEIHRSRINVSGRRVYRSDGIGWGYNEKKVDVDMATEMLLLATKAQFDLAMVVTGDPDFNPALVKVRREGKQVLVGSIQRYCDPELLNSTEVEPTYDRFIWLNQEPHVRKVNMYGRERLFNVAEFKLKK